MNRHLYILLLCFIICCKALASEEEMPLDSILKKSMDAARNYERMIERFEADVYTRTYIETLNKNFLYRYTEHIPNFIPHHPKESESVTETFSRLRFVGPNHFTQDIQYVTGSLTDRRMIEAIPVNYFNINIYSTHTFNENIIMPTRKMASKYYNYKLLREHKEKDKILYTIEFTPIYNSPKLLSGVYVIEDKTWRIVHFSASGLDIFANYSFELTMGDNWITSHLPVEYLIYQKSSFLGNSIAGRHLVKIKYKEIVFSQNIKKTKRLNISNFYKVRLDSVPVVDDTLFWAQKRPIPLQQKEIDVINKHRAELQKRSEIIISPEDSIYRNNQQIAGKIGRTIILNTRYHYKSTSIRYGGILNPALLNYSSNDGIKLRQQLSFNIDLKDSKSINISASGGYLFKRRELYTNLSAIWNYNPNRLGSIDFQAGNGNSSYSSLFIKLINNSLNRMGFNPDSLDIDYYKDYYLKLNNNIELANGLLLTPGFEYHIRVPQKHKIRGEKSIPNLDKIFNRRFSFMPTIGLQWNPEQYYRYDGKQKIYVRSKYPTLKLNFACSIKNILGSSTQFSRLEFDISQSIPLGLLNSFSYHLGAGVFFRQKTEYFANFIFFENNHFQNNLKDGINRGFNCLDWYHYSAYDRYMQAHLFYDTPFLVINRIPFISNYIEKEQLYLSQLWTPQIKSYTEIGYGLSSKYLTLGFFCSMEKLKFRKFNIRIACEF